VPANPTFARSASFPVQAIKAMGARARASRFICICIRFKNAEGRKLVVAKSPGCAAAPRLYARLTLAARSYCMMDAFHLQLPPGRSCWAGCMVVINSERGAGT
jgi:hypothetical protein